MGLTVVVAGANRGIGLELVRKLAARGDRVIATARVPGAAAALQEVARGPGSVEVHGLDVADPVQAEALASVEPTPVDLLVCNAGRYVGRGGLDDPEYTQEAWRDVLMTNVAGPFFLVRAFLKRLEAAKGRVAVISSQMASSERAPGRSYIYRASKAGATNLARNLAQDLMPHGVAVGAYHPGWVSTDMGGPQADLTPEESAVALLERFRVLSMETSGVFEDWQGRPVPF